MRHDKELLRRRFSRNLASYDSLAEVQRRVAGRLADAVRKRLSAADVRRVAEIGSGTGFLTRPLYESYPSVEWLANDLVERSRDFLPSGVRFEAGDGEQLPLPAGCDLICSASVVQWFDDLPAFIRRSAASLSPSGLLALSTFGPDNFRELTATTGEGLEYFSAEQLQAWCEAEGLELLLVEEWCEICFYSTPLDLLRHLRATGVNAVSRQRWNHSRLQQFETEYSARYGTPKGVPLTFHPILLVARKAR